MPLFADALRTNLHIIRYETAVLCYGPRTLWRVLTHMSDVHVHRKASYWYEKAKIHAPWFLLTARKLPASGPVKAEVVPRAHKAVATALPLFIMMRRWV